jgi:enoyl-CoA hydratase
LETLNFAGADYLEARQAFREKRPTRFPSAHGDHAAPSPETVSNA